jgi:hypothetical protein
VRGVVPTPLGAISVQHDVSEGGVLRERRLLQLTTRVRAPQGLAASVRLARLLGGSGELLAATVAVGEEAPSAIELRAGVASEVTDIRGRRSVVVPDVDSGEPIVVVATYALDEDDGAAAATAEAAAAAAAAATATSEAAANPRDAAKPAAQPAATIYPPYGPPQWPAAVSVDNSTHGSWLGRVGAAGYLLFAFDPAPAPGAPPTDRAALPPFIANVTWGTGAARSLAAAPAFLENEAWLQDPTAPGGPRRLGALYVGSTGGLYGLFVDVASAPSAPDFRLTAYVADTAAYDPTSGAGAAPQSMFLRAEDGSSRDALAPDVLVRHYDAEYAGAAFNSTWNVGGEWGLERGLGLSLVARGGGAVTRLRCYCVSGCYSSVSALFFDAV